MQKWPSKVAAPDMAAVALLWVDPNERSKTQSRKSKTSKKAKEGASTWVSAIKVQHAT